MAIHTVIHKKNIYSFVVSIGVDLILASKLNEISLLEETKDFHTHKIKEYSEQRMLRELEFQKIADFLHSSRKRERQYLLSLDNHKSSKAEKEGNLGRELLNLETSHQLALDALKKLEDLKDQKGKASFWKKLGFFPSDKKIDQDIEQKKTDRQNLQNQIAEKASALQEIKKEYKDLVTRIEKNLDSCRQKILKAEELLVTVQGYLDNIKAKHQHSTKRLDALNSELVQIRSVTAALGEEQESLAAKMSSLRRPKIVISSGIANSSYSRPAA